jgi:hypothetical protein
MTSKLNYVARLWYYFRIGYVTYLSFLLGAANTLVVVWYLAIREVPAIESFFGHFIPFAVVTILVGVPFAVGLGWVHLKRSPAYSSEVDIGVEANPYYYKLPPGYNREVFSPLYLELLVQVKRLLEAQKLLTDEDRARIEGLEEKLRVLNEGGFIGSPRARTRR